MPDFTIRTARWPQDSTLLRTVREQVFVEEQGVPMELEWDGADAQCHHLLAEDPQGAPIGTVRLLPDGHIGRMAVVKGWRGRGIGSCLLKQIMAQGQAQGLDQFTLNAQCEASGFYARHGFVASGPVFDDAGIPHRHMVRRLA